jgi:hypothetical protein
VLKSFSVTVYKVSFFIVLGRCRLCDRHSSSTKAPTTHTPIISRVRPGQRHHGITTGDRESGHILIQRRGGKERAAGFEQCSSIEYLIYEETNKKIYTVDTLEERLSGVVQSEWSEPRALFSGTVRCEGGREGGLAS